MMKKVKPGCSTGVLLVHPLFDVQRDIRASLETKTMAHFLWSSAQAYIPKSWSSLDGVKSYWEKISAEAQTKDAGESTG